MYLARKSTTLAQIPLLDRILACRFRLIESTVDPSYLAVRTPFVILTAWTMTSWVLTLYWRELAPGFLGCQM